MNNGSAFDDNGRFAKATGSIGAADEERLIDVLLIASPNFGILDSWLPVLTELKRRHTDITIGALMTKENALLQVHPGEDLTELGDQIFGSVIYRRGGNSWGVAQSLKHAASLWKASVKAASGSFAYRSGSWLVSKLRGSRPKPPSLQSLLGHVKAVAFDVTEQKRAITQELQTVLREAHWFSLPHGIDPKAWKWERRSPKAPNTKRSSQLKIYAVGQADGLAYRKAYALSDADIKVVGVPRHAESWMRRIEQYHKCAVPFARYVFLVSRAHKSSFFPIDRKVQALQDIKALCEELNLRLVVRLHPREKNEGLYQKIFQKDRYGTHWIFSSSHPFTLGRSAQFCISFFSSVAVDMVALGIPVIERCDFSGLTGAHELVLDAHGNPTSTYQHLGLALGAKDYGELRTHALRIMKDRHAVAKQLRAAYTQVYATLPNPIGVIADDIERCLDMTHRPRIVGAF